MISIGIDLEDENHLVKTNITIKYENNNNI